MQQFFDTLQDLNGNALTGLLDGITVLAFPGGGATTIYSDNGLTTMSSTVQADSTGQVSFYAPDGDYIIQYKKAGTVYKTRSPVNLFDGPAQVTWPDVGAVNAYAIANSALEKVLRTGLRATIKIAATNTAAPTLAYNGLAPKAIVYPGGAALNPGALLINGIYQMEYDGGSWQLRGSLAVPWYNAITAETAVSAVIVDFTVPYFYVERYGADPTGVALSDTAFATAENVAYTGGGGRIYAYGNTYSLNGTLTLRSGVTLIGSGSGGSEYYPGSPWNTVPVSRLWKKSTAAVGAHFILQTADQIRGLFLQTDKVGGCPNGQLQVGTSAAATLTDGTYNIEFEDISLFGPAIQAAALVDVTCVGLYFYDGSIANGVQRYGCRARGVRIVNFYTAIRLGNNCNANNFDGILIRQCYQHFVLDGSTELNCLENAFAGFNCFNIGLLPTVAITFTGAPALGAVSATLTGNWALQSAVIGVLFSTGEIRLVTLTQGATTATWTVPLAVAATANATAAQTIVFVLKNAAQNNSFAGYATECNGAAFYIEGPSLLTFTATLAAAATSGTLAANWTRPTGGYAVTLSNGETRTITLTNGATTATWSGGLANICQAAATVSGCVANTFLGKENEAQLSVVPVGNFHSLWAQPNSRTQISQQIIPAVATPLNFTNGLGNLVRWVTGISGTLPQLNGAGALVAADVNSKVFARFNVAQYQKAARLGFRARLVVTLNAPGGGVGDSITSVEFWYRVTDNATNAASLSVISVSRQPAANYVIGLKFLTGVNSGQGMGLAVVGGNMGAFTTTRMSVDLEIMSFTHDVTVVPMDQLAQITFGTQPATANDVADAIDLLTVANTAV